MNGDNERLNSETSSRRSSGIFPKADRIRIGSRSNSRSNTPDRSGSGLNFNKRSALAMGKNAESTPTNSLQGRSQIAQKMPPLAANQATSQIINYKEAYEALLSQQSRNYELFEAELTKLRREVEEGRENKKVAQEYHALNGKYIGLVGKFNELNAQSEKLKRQQDSQSSNEIYEVRAKYESELRFYKEENSKLKQTNEEMAKKLKFLAGEFGNYKSTMGKIEELQAENLSLRKMKESVENEGNLTKYSLKALQEKSSNQDRVIKDLEEKLMIASRRLTDFDQNSAQNSHLAEALRNAEQQVSILKQEKDKKEVELSHKLQFEKSKLQDLESKLRECTNENNSLALFFEEMKRDNGSLKSKMADLQMKLQISESSAMQMSLNVGSAEKLEAQNKELRDQVQIWMNRCNELEEKQSKTSAQSQIKIEMLQREIDGLREQLREKTKECESLKEKSKETQKMSGEIEVLKERLDYFQNELENTEEQRDMALEQLKSRANDGFLAEQVAVLRRQLEEAHGELLGKSMEIKELQNEMNHRQSGETEGLLTRLEAMKRERDQVISELYEKKKELEGEKSKSMQLEMKFGSRGMVEDSWGLKKKNEELEEEARQLREENERLRENGHGGYSEKTTGAPVKRRGSDMEAKLEFLISENNKMREILFEKDRTIRNLTEIQSRQSSGQEYRLDFEKVTEEKKALERGMFQIRQELESWRAKAIDLESMLREKNSQGTTDFTMQIINLSAENQRLREMLAQTRGPMTEFEHDQITDLEIKCARLQMENERLHSENCQNMLRRNNDSLRGKELQKLEDTERELLLVKEETERLRREKLEIETDLQTVLRNSGKESNVGIYNNEIDRLNRTIKEKERVIDQLRIEVAQLHAKENLDKSMTIAGRATITSQYSTDKKY